MPKIAWRLCDSQEESARSVSVSVVTEEHLRFLFQLEPMNTWVIFVVLMGVVAFYFFLSVHLLFSFASQFFFKARRK